MDSIYVWLAGCTWDAPIVSKRWIQRHGTLSSIWQAAESTRKWFQGKSCNDTRIQYWRSCSEGATPCCHVFLFVFQVGVARHDALDHRWWSPARVKSVKPQQRPERSELLYSFFSTSFGLVSSWSRRIQMRWEMMWRRIRSEFLRILMTWVFFGFARLIGTQGQSWARGGKRQWWWCCCKLKPH